MKKHKQILAILIFSALSWEVGQNIKSRDLRGLWGSDEAGISFMLGFFDSSRFTIDADNLPNALNPGKYELSSRNGENLLTLYFDNNGNAKDSMLYLVRKSDPDFLMLQLPARSKSGVLIYKWNISGKQNTLYLKRMESKK